MKLVDIISKDKVERKFIKPYIIAEAGVNHEGNLDVAYRLIDDAQEGGANAIKFQTYKAEKLASKNSPSYWDLTKEPTVSQYMLFKKYDSFWKHEFELIAKRCEQRGIEFLSTPFDLDSSEFLNDLMSVFKVSSSDINNRPFIEELCRFEKPIILSTGASFLWEIEQSVSWISKHGNQLALLHCILNYPTDDRNANLYVIQELSRKFPNHTIGYSDHTLPKDMKTLELATVLGARIIEKHFTHDKTLPGNDHYHSMDKKDLLMFHERLDILEVLLGSKDKEPLPSEQLARSNARRSLVSSSSIKKGQRIDKDNLTWKRPGHGIDPRDLEKVIGMKAHCDIPEDTVLAWSYLTD